MSESAIVCARCGEELAPGTRTCPACGTPVPPRAEPTGPTPVIAVRAPAPDLPRALGDRLAVLRQWAEASQSLGVSLPTLPPWAEEAMRGGPEGEEWAETVRGVERISQQRIVGALEVWERDTRNRLTRLEAYAVDGRLEREQIEDVLHAAHSGDLAAALLEYRQVDKVLSLKERHLDQARDELERIVSLLRDMQALGLPCPQDPSEVAEDLERELRSGHLAPLKQRLRTLRSEALARLETGLRQHIREYGATLLAERAQGASVDLEAAELARGAREFAKGHPEEALRRLRVLSQVHGGGLGRPVRGRPPVLPDASAPGDAPAIGRPPSA